MPYIITSSGQVEQLVAPSTDSFTIIGAGWGHNVGMSQWGAYAMAKAGKTAEEIVMHYFRGVTLSRAWE